MHLLITSDYNQCVITFIHFFYKLWIWHIWEAYGGIKQILLPLSAQSRIFVVGNFVIVTDGSSVVLDYIYING